jgi:hypothetical protein
MAVSVGPFNGSAEIPREDPFSIKVSTEDVQYAARVANAGPSNRLTVFQEKAAEDWR